MAKSPLERQIESQMKQAKQLADKKRREDEKRVREQKRMEQKAIVRDRASSIVNGQPWIEGFRIMDKTAEEMLLIRVGETKCFGVILLLAVGYTFLKLSYSPLDSSAFLYRFALGGIIYSLLCFLEITALKKIYMEDWTDYENRCY